MESELHNFIKVWIQAIILLSYSYLIAKFVGTGIPRLLAILPVVAIFLTLPLHLRTVHLSGTFAFFIAWLANFKLLLFAFGKGPLSDPSLSLKRFLALSSFPIQIQQPKSQPHHKPPFIFPVKALLFAGVLKLYEYDYIHPKGLLLVYCLNIYLCLEMVLAMVAALARTLLGIHLEPQFNEPYLSSSLQDFWGRRWNLMVTKILRPTVYEPTVYVASRLIGRKWASFLGVFATFVVSGLYHEIIFYYLGRVKPTWEITCYFLLHGFCLLLEIFIKKKLGGKFRLPRLISGPLTVGFVMVTTFWLFFPPLLRCNGDKRALQEYAAVATFVKDVSRSLIGKN
ncbi:hypothetical protein L6164_032293 [Bauhinia variegata]|uniref:Uncharacterized protein n=1 Tax=Bauhinia variegata TaxID=167791 RepID=A0ACB9KNP8_BAUVA|nr:hypothetical protein L6164_032293 [Bauhinia variegata]